MTPRKIHTITSCDVHVYQKTSKKPLILQTRVLKKIKNPPRPCQDCCEHASHMPLLHYRQCSFCKEKHEHNFRSHQKSKLDCSNDCVTSNWYRKGNKKTKTKQKQQKENKYQLSSRSEAASFQSNVVGTPPPPPPKKKKKKKKKTLNLSTVPHDLNIAVVKPLLKNPSHDKNLLKNYRPISNLPFLSKILEKVVLHKLLSHLQENNLGNPFQSACRAGHSAETVSLRKQYSFRSGQWQHFCSSFVGSFCRFWHYWPPNSPLPPELCFWHSVYCTPMVSVIPLRQI